MAIAMIVAGSKSSGSSNGNAIVAVTALVKNMAVAEETCIHLVIGITTQGKYSDEGDCDCATLVVIVMAMMMQWAEQLQYQHQTPKSNELLRYWI